MATEATSNCPGSGPAGCQCQCHTHGCQDPPLPDDGTDNFDIAEASRAMLKRAIADKQAARAKGNSGSMPPPSPKVPSCLGGSIAFAKASGGAALQPTTSAPSTRHLLPTQLNSTTRLLTAAEAQVINDARAAAELQAQLMLKLTSTILPTKC